MNKSHVLMNKSIYLAPSIPELSKTVMYDFCYDYVKPKYCEKAKVCYMETDSFLAYIKADNFDITKYVKTRSETSNYELNRSLPKGKINEVSLKN